jgi:hypothetical protein
VRKTRPGAAQSIEEELVTYTADGFRPGSRAAKSCICEKRGLGATPDKEPGVFRIIPETIDDLTELLTCDLQLSLTLEILTVEALVLHVEMCHR